MTIASCPKCGETVRIPPSASPRASVRCPLCQEEFLLAEVLDSLPPLLEITDDLDQPDRAFAPQAAEEYGLAPLEADTASKAAPAFSIDSSRDVSAPASVATAKRRKGPVRPQRKKKSPVAEVVKIVLGGVAGLVIAQLLLWWMPWQDLRRDPFALGPSISKFAPWLVPARFHGGPEVGRVPADERPFAAADTLDSGLPQPNLDQPITQDQATTPENSREQARDAEPDPFDLSAGQDPISPPAVDPFGATVELPSIPPSTDLDDDLLALDPAMDFGADFETDPTLDIETDPALDIETDPALGVETDPAATVATNGATEPPSVNDGRPVRHLASPTLFDADALAAALKPVQPEFEALSVAGTEEAILLVTRNYTRFTELAEKIVLSEDLEHPIRQEAARLLLSLVEKPDVISRLRQAGEVWWGAGSRRTNDGVLLIGKVQSIDAEDFLFRTELQLGDGSRLTSYSDTDPSDLMDPEDLVLLVGAVVEDPADRLLGYSGEDEQVLWAPFFRAVP